MIARSLATALLAVFAATCGATTTPTIPAPRDVAWPGTLQLQVDATDTARGIWRVRERVPVRAAGPMTLLFPQWMPGDHAPTGAIDRLAGLVITAAGRRLAWTRDPVQVFAFHVDVPRGVAALDLQFQFLDAGQAKVGPVLVTPTMLDLQWQDVVLYPAGHAARRITLAPSVALPAGWNFASALDGARRDGDTVRFAPVTLDTLVDSPLMAARWMRRIALADTPSPVSLTVAADREADLAVPDEAVAAYRRAVVQADRLFGARHYDHYDLLLWLSNDFGFVYYEHHRSGEVQLPAAMFSDWAKYGRYAGAPMHAFVHSWNGLFRRPGDMAPANFNEPERDGLLWVFEGLTMYWADVLCARSGLATPDAVRSALMRAQAAMSGRPGADWRSLTDASHQNVIQHGNGDISPDGRELPWPSWQRGISDPYLQGELIWLDVDTLIRQRTQGRRSLDDFARAFFGMRDGDWGVATYRFEDLVAALNAVMPYDWAGFLHERVDAVGPPRLDGLARGGYRIAWDDAPPVAKEARRAVDLPFSLGMSVAADGTITGVTWDGPAFQAGLAAGTTIVAINDVAYGADAIVEAVVAGKSGAPLALKVRRGVTERAVAIAWTGGLRMPKLQRIPEAPAILDDILEPRT